MTARLLLFVSGPLFAASHLGAEGLSLQQREGREIYRHGKLNGSAVGVAAVGGDGMALPSSLFACANCHGIWGEGGREGGIETPPLNWRRLMSPAASAITGRRRGSYTPETLRRAITEGLDSMGKRLHAGMPRYNMPGDRLNELLSYFERIGDPDDNDPGVSDKSIRIGAALPLSGPMAAAGQSIRETLELQFRAESRGGGVYQRNLELVVEDSRGEPAGFLEGTRRLIEHDNVFALVGSLQPIGSGDAGQLLESAGVPLIGPVTLSPHQNGAPNPYIFYLLPSLYDQARALVDFIAARSKQNQRRLAVIHSGTAQDKDVVDGLRHQAGIQGLTIVGAERDSPQAVPAILATHPDYLVFSGDGAGLARVARLLDGPSPPMLAGFVSMTQSGVDRLPENIAARVLLAAPSFPPDTHDAEAFFAVLEAGKSPRTFLGLRMAAYASGAVLVQGLRSSGSRLSRDSLVHTLERLQHFETGTTAPVTFGPNQRVGSAGAVVLSFELSSRTFVPASGWVAPKN